MPDEIFGQKFPMGVRLRPERALEEWCSMIRPDAETAIVRERAMAPDDFRLVPASVSTRRGPRTNLYADVVEAFLASPEPSVRVDLPGKRPATVTRGLHRAIASSDVTVHVAQVDGKVYLHR